jgi:hypothetical protein
MNDPQTCPYGPESCPKLAAAERQIAQLEERQLSMIRMLYYIVGAVSASVGLGIGGLIL